MRIGWLVDRPAHYAGGAEMEALELLQAAPPDVTVVPCPADKMRDDVDVYVVHNCTQYGHNIIPCLARKPVVKRVHDLWPNGDHRLRQWLLGDATLLLLSSPLQHQEMRWRITAPVQYVPSAVNIARFRHAARQTNGQRCGVVWLGRLWPGKGIEQARRWAVEQGVAVDVYGFGPLEDEVTEPLRYKGPLAQDAVPELLTRHETFLFLPDAVEPYSRATVEAWAAGCRLVVNGNVGALWWIKNDQAAIHLAAKRFWQAVRETVAGLCAG